MLSFFLSRIHHADRHVLHEGIAQPPTNRGVHDCIVIFSICIVVGAWALILAWRLGPRLGTFTKHGETQGPVAQNFAFLGPGVGLLLFAAPFAFLGCGY